MPAEFQLLDKEKIVEDIKPMPALRLYFTVQSIFAAGMIAFFFGIAFAIALSDSSEVSLSWFIGCAVVFLALWIVGSFIVAQNRYTHQHYWVTNKRVIYKSGILGYSINSIPLERISDVRVSRGWLENLLGFGSIYIESMAGQLTRYTGAEGNLLAVPSPESTQKLIFKLVQEKRKREHLTM